jgi:hypothetical protein
MVGAFSIFRNRISYSSGRIDFGYFANIIQKTDCFSESNVWVYHGAIFLLMRTRNGTKKAAAHIRNSGLRPEILFGSFLTSAHRLRNRFPAKPPWLSPTRLADRRFRGSHS